MTHISDIRDSIQWRIMDALNIDDYGMFSIRGNAKVAAMVKRANALPEDDRGFFVETEMERIEAKHPEVYDTDVREAIQEAVPEYSAYG